MRLRFKIARCSLVLAALLYLGVPLETATGFPLDPTRSYLSELAASDQPNSSLFRIADAVAGGLVVLGCLVMAHRGVQRDRLRAATLLTLGVFGLGTIADVVVPMACAPSASERCAAADVAGTLGSVHALHTVASVIALTAAATTAVLLSLTAVKTPQGPGPLQDSSGSRRRVVCMYAVTGLVIASSVLVTAMSMSHAATGTLPFGGGIAQRAQTLGISVMLCGVPFWLDRRSSRPTTEFSSENTVVSIGVLATAAVGVIGALGAIFALVLWFSS